MEPATSKRFTSRYRRRTRGKSQVADAPEAKVLDVVEEEVVGEAAVAA